MFYELSLVAFAGSENNNKFHNKKLVLWDNNLKNVIHSTQFKSPILNIRIVKKLIFLSTKDEVNICNFNDKKNYIEIIAKVKFDTPATLCFEIWSRAQENIQKYFLATVINKNYIQITTIFENCLEEDCVKSFDCGIEFGVQNLIYDEKLDVLFVIDLNGSNIKGFSCTNNFSLIFNLYRGKSFSLITSIISIRNKYLAVASSNRTIHIFDISEGKSEEVKKSTSYVKMFYNFFTNPFKLNKSILKIRLNEEITGSEFDFYEVDFKKKGTILIYNEKKDELVCLGYNGKICIIKLEVESQTYLIKYKFDWCSTDDIKVSQYISEDFCTLELYSVNNKTEIESENDNWKII
jgi:hypothetical protein